MRFTLSRVTKRLIQDRMDGRGYATVDELIQAALGSLEQVEKFGDFEPGELDRLIAEGEVEGGDSVDGDKVFEEIRLSKHFRQGRGDACP